MKLLIVDDNETNLKIFSMILSLDGYEIKTISSAEEIDSKLNSDVDLILLSSKFEKACEKLNEKKVIVMTSNPSVDEVVRFYSNGIKDYIILPASADVIRNKVDEAISKEKTLEDILSSFRHVQVKDDGSYKHLERMKAYARILATELKESAKGLKIDEDFIKNLELASVLHDIGKTKILDKILKKPAKLTEEEFQNVKKHSILCYRMLENLKNTPFVKMAKEVVLSHHERYDGTGYPDQKSGEEIPLSARIVALCDVYDALRETRVYKENFSHEKSVEIIKGSSKKQFDTVIIEAFEKVHNKFDEIFNKLNLKK